MENRDIPDTLLRSRCWTAAVIIGSLVILGAIILGARAQLRHQVREQIAGQNAKVLHTLLLGMQLDESAFPVTDQPESYLESVLDTSRFRQLPSVKAMCLFDGQGTFLTAFPADAPETALRPEDLAELQRLEPRAHFHPQVHVSELAPISLADAPEDTLPILEVLLPLHAPGQKRLAGVAQFFLDGHGVAQEFAALDRHLARQALAAFLTAGAMLTALLGLALRQLQKTNALLAQRTQHLLRANQELSLAAKTAAVGAVSAHLIHGLKNPLCGLQSFMSSRGALPAPEDTDWEMAVATTRRMQSLINDVVRVLREQDSVAQFELSLDEIVEIVRSKSEATARSLGVNIQIRGNAYGRFSNRDANLILLILENLMTNAVQATPRQKAVTLEVSARDDSVLWLVRDEGAGLPDAMKNGLFKPCQSTKEGGSGIGLAICKQLANALEADLELRSTSASGSVFALIVPLKLCAPLPSVSSA